MNPWTVATLYSLQHSQFAAMVVDAFLKSLVILLVAGGACLCLRRSASSARHLIWFLALTGLLCLPILSQALPSWQRPLWTVGTRANANNELTLTLEFVPARMTTTAQTQTTAPSSGTAPTKPASAQDGFGQQLTTRFTTGWAALLVAGWMAGASVILLSIVVGQLRLRSFRRNMRPPVNPDWHPLLRQLCAELAVQRPVTLLQSHEDVMPMTWGWLRPVILLPANADNWPEERRRVVLLHELSHVKRRDCLTQLVARLACATYWFNPLVWMAARRMRIERESACDDMVLNGGCKASDYATHLVEIATTLRRVPPVEAIAMARSSRLKDRITAIVDASRPRRTPHTLLVSLCSIAVLALVASVAAQKPEVNSSTPEANVKPWFDARLRAFFTTKEAQAHKLAEGKSVAPEVWPYFEAGKKGDWTTATNLWVAMRGRAHQYEGTKSDDSLDTVWGPILETDLAWQEFSNWKEKYVLAYGNDIIKSIPPGSIYFGGTDPGRGVITAMSESHAEGKPFYTITQNALADSTYLDYVRAMYGSTLQTLTDEDSKKYFQEYTADAVKRLNENKLKPGEDVRMKDNNVQVSGQVAVMGINGLLTKALFDLNPDREFYVEESFPLDWMYPYLSPNGLILKINRKPLESLPEGLAQKDREYWTRHLQPMMGDWLKEDTSVAEIAAFAEKVYLKHDLGGFTGDPQFITDTWAQKAFSKLRSAIAGIYAWRVTNAKTPDEKQRMMKEADYAFRQAYALCPTSPETLFRYVNLLITSGRAKDALLIAETSLKFDPNNGQIKSLIDNLKSFKPKE
jgi:beta-lactamase regulating signal transducer with metallopeptidase domain